MSGLIYILQDGHDLNTDIYKIGKTNQPIKNRLLTYSKKTVLYETYNVNGKHPYTTLF